MSPVLCRYVQFSDQQETGRVWCGLNVLLYICIQYSWFEWPNCSHSLVHLTASLPFLEAHRRVSHSRDVPPAINMSLSSPKVLTPHVTRLLFFTCSLKMEKVQAMRKHMDYHHNGGMQDKPEGSLMICK